MAYATRDDVLLLLDQVADSDAAITSGDVFSMLLEQSTSIIDGALGFSFQDNWSPSTSVKRVRAYGGEYLILPPHKRGSITLVKHGTTTIDAASYAETDSGNLQVISNAVAYPLVWDNVFGWYGWGAGVYDVTAIWGYGPPPESIKRLCLELTINAWRTKDNGMFQEILGAADGAALRYVGGLNSTQRMIVENVKRAYQPEITV